MPAAVSKVLQGSIAEELKIAQGDEIISIDGNEMLDMIDYNFYCKSENLILKVKKYSGEIEEIEIEKDFDEDLGIIFESAVFNGVKPCLNKCIFCFVDQQPEGLRGTLYVKDDDYRLSYLQGTYITLTNLTDKDKERIKRLRLGPFYVSVHTTNPDLRIKMLRNPNAGKIMENLKWFRKNGIPFHAQIVLCPGYNDGKELKRTLSDLASLKNTVLSTAIVPVGLTKFRKENLQRVDKKTAQQTIEISCQYKRVCCSDEFFLLAGIAIPPAKYYGNFAQLEDGVGAIRLLLENFKKLTFPVNMEKPVKILFATSFAAKGAIEIVCTKLNKIKNLTAYAAAVKSDYWGEDITVAGLITSSDLINTVKRHEADYVVIPSVMLRQFSQDFLDGKNLDHVKKVTGKKFIVINDIYSMKELADYLFELCK